MVKIVFEGRREVLSGKMGEVVYSIRQGRMYGRKFVKPEQPNTAAQQRTKERFALAVSMAKLADRNAITNDELRITRKARAGRWLKTNPSRWAALVSSLMNGGVLFQIVRVRSGIITIKMSVIDGQVHWIDVANADGEKRRVIVPATGGRYRLQRGTESLWLDGKSVRFRISEYVKAKAISDL